MRNAADGSGASGTIEPFAAVGKLFPSGVTNGSGGGPSQVLGLARELRKMGHEARVLGPCDCTPPGIVKL